MLMRWLSSGNGFLIPRNLIPGIAALLLIANVAFPQGRGSTASSSLTLPEMPARTSAELDKFVEGVSQTDAELEVLVGHGRLLTLKSNLIEEGKAQPLIAVGNPSVADFQVVGERHVRVIGQRVGSTDLSITTADNETYTFQVRVVIDLKLLSARLDALFPAAEIRLRQISGHVLVEGQARDSRQVARIIDVTEAFLDSVENEQSRQISGDERVRGAASGRPSYVPEGGVPPGPAAAVQPEKTNLKISGQVAQQRVINLLTVPGPQQVMLKVQVAELNRTAMRQLGVSSFFNDGTSAIGSNISGAAVPGAVITGFTNPATTLAGVVMSGGKSYQYWLDALRRNSVLKVLAEPTLVAYNGHEASFLAGGEFPIPVPQGGGGLSNNVTVQFREFGVRLSFLPTILDDEAVRLTVSPEVSTIDFTLGTTLVAGGTPVPGLNTRRSSTTVEMRHGETLAMAGLLQVTLDGTTRRIPGLGDAPVIGTLFSNNTGQRQEKELVVLVTPYLVEPRSEDELLPLPGDEVNEPNDLEFYLLQRIESRVGRDFRSTTKWDDPLKLVDRLKLERRYIQGPHGYPE